jgi:quinol monooxygenase YgiN
MAFTQTMTVQASSPAALVDLLEGWHRDQHGVAPGYEGARLLADRSRPGRFVIEVDFSSQEAAQQNDGRKETRAWADRLAHLSQGQPEYHDYEVAYLTG